ncbi:MAG TPA: hypothetical protein VFA59_07130 [Vicinamibacterales bacterium]|nr:hypothetical protein [Vicinamibacterales bacterium]
MPIRSVAFGMVVMVTAMACGSRAPSAPSSNPSGVPGFSVSPPSGGVAQFTVIPVDLTVRDSLTALGNLNPPGHTLPTDHVYFYQGSLSTLNPFGAGGTRTVRAPTTGAVLQMLAGSLGEYKVVFIVTPTFQYYFDHLVPRAGLAVGQTVNAGDIVGTSSTTLDLGAFDYTTTLTGFVTSSRYGDQTLHCVSPWKYFVEPLRSQVYSFVYRAPTAPDRDGKIDFDIPGRLVGAWYDPSVPSTGGDASWGPSSWPKSMTFAYDYYDPSQVRIAIGGTIAAPGVWAIDASAPPPADVSVATGKIVYRLMSPFDAFVQYGVMAVQMITDTTMKVEVFPGVTDTGVTFDANAHTWTR